MLICSTTATTAPASKYRKGLVAKFSAKYLLTFQQQQLQQVNLKRVQKFRAKLQFSKHQQLLLLVKLKHNLKLKKC